VEERPDVLVVVEFYVHAPIREIARRVDCIMLVGLIEGFVWFKSTFPLLFEVGKIGGALVGAYFGFRKMFRASLDSLSAELNSKLSKLKEVEHEEAQLKTDIAALKKKAEAADEETRALRARSAEAVLEKAAREREQGNHEIAARLLADWHKAESPGLAEAAQHLASWHDEILKQRTGDYDQKLTVERLQSLAELAAPDVVRQREAAHV